MQLKLVPFSTPSHIWLYLHPKHAEDLLYKVFLFSNAVSIEVLPYSLSFSRALAGSSSHSKKLMPSSSTFQSNQSYMC